MSLEAQAVGRTGTRVEAESRKAVPGRRLSVSVLIATRDRPDDLRRCLASLETQHYEGALEVIIVDQSASDASRAVLPEIVGIGMHYLHHPVPGKARALNRALELASGDVLLLTDDDCCVTACWIDMMSARLEADEDLAVVFGPVVAAPHDRKEHYVPVFEPDRERLLHGLSGRLARLGLGANMALRKRSVAAVGGWDEAIGPGGEFRSGDDLDIAFRCLRAGGSVLIETGCPVIHYGMRPYEGGAVRRLHRSNYYGLGATMTKHMRCGDPVAILRLAGAIAGELREIAINLVRHRRVTGAGRLIALLQGAKDAARHPIDRVTRRFLNA